MSGILHQIAHHARREPGIPALADGSGSVTYGDLHGEIAARASRLRAADCRVLGIAGDNGIEWMLWDLAALAADTVCVPLPPFFGVGQLEHVLQTAGVSHIADVNGLESTGTKALPHLPAGTSKITFTSGTTGRPKGVCLPQHALERVARGVGQVVGADAVKTHLCILPLSILLENVAGTYTALWSGATVFAPPLASIGLGDPFKPDFDTLADRIAAVEDASIILVPELLRGLVAVTRRRGLSFPGLRFAAVGGARVARSLLHDARSLGLPVYEGYGLSECGSVIALNVPGSEKQETCGRLLPQMRAEVVDGEIVVLAPAFLGYLDGAGTGERFPTGDLGAIDAEGFISISGRKKNIIITGYGRNVSPEWIESLLLAEPGVMQALVYGDDEERPCALIVPAPAAAVDAVVRRVNRQLPEYAKIGRYEISAPFSIADGTLTANGRPVRGAILNRHVKVNP